MASNEGRARLVGWEPTANGWVYVDKDGFYPCPAYDTSLDAVKRIMAMEKFAKAHERWEANLILSEKAWDGGAAALPTLTEELWDEALEVQKLRNAALQTTREHGDAEKTR